ncbi:MAG: hypothetical protein MPJ78_20090 [Hyphomicrobiaceae bacterium]|nr:hypothetical protein [Hyphomicrobiaceae bacterium]
MTHAAPEPGNPDMEGGLPAAVACNETDGSARAMMADPVQRHVLSLLGTGGGPMARTKLQKAMYLLSVDHPREGSNHDFRPYKYGPYCRALARACEKLEKDGIIGTEDPGPWASYRLTEKGRPVGEEAARREDGKVLGSFRDYHRLFDGMGHDDMLAYIHVMFPGMAADSKKRDYIEENKKHFVLKMVRMRKISPGRGAELLGMPQDVLRNEEIFRR